MTDSARLEQEVREVCTGARDRLRALESAYRRYQQLCGAHERSLEREGIPAERRRVVSGAISFPNWIIQLVSGGLDGVKL